MKEKEVLNIINNALTKGRNFLYEYEAKEVLSLLGIKTTKSILVKTESEVKLAVKQIGYPLALKIVSPHILHKSDVGGVLLGLKDEQEVRIGYNKILKNVKSQVPDVNILGVLVQEMAPPSIEIIVGAMRDPQFGPAIIFGIGGILVEIIKDVSFGVAPLTRMEAEEMVKSIKAYNILEGARGFQRADLSAIIEILLKISDIMMDYPEINAIDLNPIIVYERGSKVVDARFILGEEKKSETKIRPTSIEFDAILEPSSVAVIGASTNVDKIGHKILKNIIKAGFRGKIYPINPRAEEILGLKSYPSVLNVPYDIDLGIIVVPAPVVLSVIKECVQKSVKGAVIISSGFRDVGPEGAALERQILEIAKQGGLRIIGPNCQGISIPKTGLCATWPLIKEAGNVAVISQSGTITLELSSFLSRNELGYSKAIALGNKSDLDEADLISWLADDECTKVIAVYSEGIANGRRLMSVIKKASKKKPVLFLKGGKTEEGKRAVLAHTGSLAGKMEVFEAAMRQSGGLCVKNLEELCDAAKAFSTLPIPKGNRVLVITSSGGSGILASDACDEAGLVLSNLSKTTRDKLEHSLPAWCIIRNTLDLTGNVLNNIHLYYEALNIALVDESVDMVLLIYGDPIPDALKSIEGGIRKAFSLGVPIAVAYLGGAEIQITESKKFQKNGIPVYSTPSRAIVALSYLYKYHKQLVKHKNT